MSQKSKSDKKQERARLIQEEKQRRRQDLEERSPLDFAQMLSLKEHVSRKLFEKKSDEEFQNTKGWAEQNGVDTHNLITFLKAERIVNDFDVATSADPYKLFGPRDGRYVHMPLDYEELDALLDDLDETVSSVGCDHTHKHTELWLEERRKDIPVVLIALISLGGGCDCEVVMNVEPEDGIYE